MDWRERNYYLFHVPYETYDQFLSAYHKIAPSLKIHAPYNHIKNSADYDGNVLHIYVQGMISCRFSDVQRFEKAFHEKENVHRRYCLLKQLSKELTGQ